MEAKSNSPLETHSCVIKLQLPGYIENHQFDAEECMTHIVNLFNPRVNDINDPRNNQVPDDCLFLSEELESVYCQKCYKDSAKNSRQTLSQIEFSEFESIRLNSIEQETDSSLSLLPMSSTHSSIKSKIEKMTNDPYGEMIEHYQCENCRTTKPNGTDATRSRTLMNINKYLTVQLKIFGYDTTTGQHFKKNPILRIQEQVENILLGNLNLRVIVYHIGETSDQGHYVTSVKYGDHGIHVMMRL